MNHNHLRALLFVACCIFIIAAGIAIDADKGGLAMACSAVATLLLFSVVGLDEYYPD